MAEFQRSPLRILDRIYNFVGGNTGTRAFNLEGAIQPVHDLSREAEVGSGYSQALGYFYTGVNEVHAGAATAYQDLDPFEQATFQGRERSETGIWICGAHMTASTAIATVGIVTVKLPTITGAFSGQIFPLFMFLPNSINTGSGGNVEYQITSAGRISYSGAVLQPHTLPLFIPNGTTMEFRTTASAAGTIRLMALCWAGPLGVRPPHVP